MIQYKLISIFLVYLTRKFTFNIEKSKSEQTYTIFPGSCLNISLLLNKNTFHNTYYFEDYKKQKFPLYDEFGKKLTATNFNFDTHDKWMIICGGEYYRSRGKLIIEYSTNDIMFSVKIKLYFSIEVYNIVGNVHYYENLKKSILYPSRYF